MILRTFGCDQCGHTMTVELRSEEWNAEPPECPQCSGATYQEFFPPAIGGSNAGKARALAETIAAEDYQVADMATSPSRGRTVRYKDQGAEAIPASSWAAAGSQLSQAVALGRETRLRYGNGLDVLKGALESGAQRDLIADSKRRSIKVY
jgi:hypothetical protein